MPESTGPGYFDRRPPAPPGSGRRMAIVALITSGAMVLMLISFWGLVRTDIFEAGSDDAPVQPAAQPQASEKPKRTRPAPTANPAPSARSTPPAPGSNQLTSGSWLLSRYFISPEDNKLAISATVVNRSGETASAQLSTFVYTNGEPVGLATGQAIDVPPDSAVEVTLESDDTWTAGNKVVFFEAEPLDPTSG